MTTRRRAREIVLQILYQDDVHTMRNRNVDTAFIDRRMLGNKPLIAFAGELLTGVRANREKIDKMIGEYAVNWSVKRMSTIDRNILRLATYELLYTDVPDRVAINEAIELAKRYGQHNSSSFVNGIMDRAIRIKAESVKAESETQSVQ